MPIPNVVRYSTGSLSGVLRKGNFYLGAADQDYGPSNITGYYNGVTSSTYTVYVWDGSEIRYNIPTDDSDLSSFLSNRAGVNFSGLTESLLWSVTQSDIMIANKTYESVITDSLVINYDASFISSYPRSGTRWYNIAGTSSGVLTNGPSFSFTNIFFDGVDDHIDLGTVSSINFSNGITIEAVLNFSTLGAGGWERFVELNDNSSSTSVTFGRNSTFQTFLFQCRNITGGDAQRRFISSTNQLVVGQTAMFTTTLPAGTPGNPTSGCKLYKNGVEVAGAEQVSGEFPRLPSTVNRNTCYIGRSPFVGNAYFNGSYFSLRIYNRTLSATEIRQNYQSTLPKMMNENIVANGLAFFTDANYSTSFTTASNTWFDLSGFANNGTLTNGPTYSLVSGRGAISFDGVNDFVVSGSNSGISGNSPRTIQAWFNMNGATYSSYAYYSIGKIGPRDGFGAANGNVFEILVRYETDQNKFKRASDFWNYILYQQTFSLWGHFYGVPNPVYYFDVTVPLNTWAMVTLVHTGTTASITLNGNTPTANANNVVARTLNTTNTAVEIGRPSFTSGHKFASGLISEFRVYNRALSQSEISQIFEAQRSFYGI